VEAAISRGTMELCTAAHHLQGGQVLLPPEVLLVLWTHGREHVVGVHHDVDEGVEQAEEGAVATWGELNAEPDRHGHAAVMDDVQRGNLASLLAQHEENLWRRTTS